MYVGLVSVLKSLTVLGHATFETLSISVPAVYKAQLGQLTTEACDEKLKRWSGHLLDFVGVRLEVRGIEQLQHETGPFIVVSNHQSLYDIPVLYQALPLSLRMAAKKELFRTPIWGKAMRAAGFVEIDRKNRDRAYQALGAAGALLRDEGLSLHLAPEGTRSKTGRLGRFKRGAFDLAQAAQLPVLPVCISGAIRVHRSGTMQVHRDQSVTVTLLPALHPNEFSTTEALRDAAHSAIEGCLVAQNVSPI